MTDNELPTAPGDPELSRGMRMIMSEVMNGLSGINDKLDQALESRAADQANRAPAETRDWHDAPWVKHVWRLDSGGCGTLLDVTSALLCGFPDMLSSPLESELVILREAVHEAHPGMAGYHGKYAPGKGQFPIGSDGEIPGKP